MTKIVVVGDLHFHPGYDNKRADAIGEFAAEELQGCGDEGFLILMGDVSDCVAFNDHGTKMELEGARWKEDIDVTRDGLNRLMLPFHRRKRKMPHRIVTLGNHENRVNRWIAQEPRFEGMMDIDELGFSEFGFTTHPYGKMVNIGGVNFVHNLGSQTGRAAAITSPSNGIKSIGVSTVVGHSHKASYTPVPYRDRYVHGIDSGCATHKDMGFTEGWSHQTAHLYRRCVWVLDNVEAGDFSFKQVRLEDLGV
jgi:hypothetical protein